MGFVLPIAAAAFPATFASMGMAVGSTGLALASAGLGAATSIIGGIQGASGARQEGNARAQSDLYNAQVSRNNATIATNNSQLAAEAGEANTATKLMETRAKVGGILANQGASGLDVNSGSAPDVRASASETGQLSAINIRAQAVRQAYGYQNEAVADVANAGLQTAQAGFDKAAGKSKAEQSLLGGFASAGSGFTNYLNASSSLNTSDDGGLEDALFHKGDNN